MATDTQITRNVLLCVTKNSKMPHLSKSGFQYLNISIVQFSTNHSVPHHKHRITNINRVWKIIDKKSKPRVSRLSVTVNSSRRSVHRPRNYTSVLNQSISSISTKTDVSYVIFTQPQQYISCIHELMFLNSKYY